MSNLVNNPDSQNDVLTTVSHFLAVFEDFVRQEMPQVGVVYDPDFSYETGLARFIEQSNYNEGQASTKELFIINRTISEDSIQGVGGRAKNQFGTKRTSDGEILKYSCAYSEYDLNFMYVSHSLEMIEKFEVVYNSNEGVSSARELIVDMGELGEFKYYLSPLPLTDITITGEGGVTYKAIMGIIRVRGFFFTFNGKSKVIQEIKTRILNQRDPLSDSPVIEEININQG